MISNSPNNQLITCLVPPLPAVGETLNLWACPYCSPSHIIYSLACPFPFIPFHHHLLSTPVSTLTNKWFSACSSLTYPFHSLPFSFSTLISTPVSTFTHRFSQPAPPYPILFHSLPSSFSPLLAISTPVLTLNHMSPLILFLTVLPPPFSQRARAPGVNSYLCASDVLSVHTATVMASSDTVGNHRDARRRPQCPRGRRRRLMKYN